MKSDFPRAHILLLTWNEKKLTENCINSILEIDYPNFELTVIDNNSSDDSLKYLYEHFPHINFLKLEENFKFAEGYNKAIERIDIKDNEYLVLINNDTIVSRNFLDPLINTLQENPKNIVSVPKILYADQTNLIWFAGARINLWLGLIYHIGIRKEDGPKFAFQSITDYATGCCFCILKSDFDKIGGFDSSFSFYCEDVDFSLKARSLKREIVYNPKSVILHHVSKSLGSNSFTKLSLKFKNQIKLFWNHANFFQVFTISIFWIIFFLPYNFLKYFLIRFKDVK